MDKKEISSSQEEHSDQSEIDWDKYPDWRQKSPWFVADRVCGAASTLESTISKVHPLMRDALRDFMKLPRGERQRIVEMMYMQMAFSSRHHYLYRKATGGLDADKARI